MNKIQVVVETDGGPLVSGYVNFETLGALRASLNGSCATFMVEDPTTGKETLVVLTNGKISER
jgi:hypothetical protein